MCLLQEYWLRFISGLSSRRLWDFDNFNLPIENCTIDVSSCVKTDINAFVHSRKYQVRLKTSLCLFSLYNPEESIFVVRTSILVPITILMTIINVNEIRHCSASSNFDFPDYWQLCNSVLNENNIFYPSFLHLISASITIF